MHNLGELRRKIANVRNNWGRHCEEPFATKAIHSFFAGTDGLLRRIRLRPKAGFGGQESSSQ